MNIQRVLAVCTGNICRSPMAEYFLKQQHPQLNIQSAGIAALVGQVADPKAIVSMDQYKINIRPHIARQININLIKWADIIFVMTQNQKIYIELTWPFAYGRVFRIGHWKNQNVSDPYPYDQSFFNEICCLIQTFSLDWQPHLLLEY